MNQPRNSKHKLVCLSLKTVGNSLRILGSDFKNTVLRVKSIEASFELSD